MKLLLFLFASMGAALAGDLSQVHSVYILAMPGGLDQHIANRLTDTHLLQVVTDPKKADVVLTDRLGPGFEDRMTELYPPPPPPEKPKPDTPAGPGSLVGAVGGDTVNKLSRPTSSFGSGKGTVFLVSVKSREVLWSTYEKPKDTRGEQLERSAGKICAELKKSISGKP